MRKKSTLSLENFLYNHAFFGHIKKSIGAKLTYPNDLNCEN